MLLMTELTNCFYKTIIIYTINDCQWQQYTVNDESVKRIDHQLMVMEPMILNWEQLSQED